MTVKLDFQGRWVNPDEFFALQRARAAPVAAPPPDAAVLPSPQDLPADQPLVTLGDKCPAVRRYINRKGRIRSGLTPEEQRTAQAIVDKYAPPPPVEECVQEGPGGQQEQGGQP
ncbi:MAG: hypothetical protein V2A79_10100 [Planctomycetota bacterium]